MLPLTGWLVDIVASIHGTMVRNQDLQVLQCHSFTRLYYVNVCFPVPCLAWVPWPQEKGAYTVLV